MSLNIGNQAPDFNLPSTTGNNISLSDLKGKKVVLYFYPKDNTSGCTLEAKDFDNLKTEFESSNAVILGVSPDSIKSHNSFIDKQCLSFTLLSDESKEVLQTYQVWVEKSMYGKKYMGVERSTFLIDEAGKIAQIWRKVNVPQHAQAVLEACKKI